MSPSRRDLMRYSLAVAASAPLARGWQVLAEEKGGDEGGPEGGKTPVPEPRIGGFERLAFGMFVHWGLYSQRAAGEWTKHLHEVPTDEYFELTAPCTCSSSTSPPPPTPRSA